MTTPADLKAWDKADQKISANGENVSVEQVTRTGSGPSSSVSVVLDDTHVVKATPPLEYEEKHVDGQTIVQGDCFIMVSGKSLDPWRPTKQTTRRVTDVFGDVWTVKNVRAYPTGARIPVFEFHLRK